MCLICAKLINKKMTINEAENAALEITVTSALYLGARGLDHTINLLESLQDLDLERLEKTLEEGTQGVQV